MKDINKVLEIINLLSSPKSVETVKKLSDFAEIDEKDAIMYIDNYHSILEYQNRFAKYGMDNEIIRERKNTIIYSIFSNMNKEDEVIFAL